MSVQVKPALSAVAFFATALSSAVLAPSSANAADACLTAPNAPAPQGSHWYYRVERPSLRKCWRLVAKDQKDQRATARATQPEPEDGTQAAPAPTASKPAERQAEPEVPPPAPVIRTLVTRNVSNTNDTAPLQPPEPSANTPSADAPVPVAQAATGSQTPTTLDQPAPQPVVASASTEAPDGAPTWGHLLGAIALLGFLSSAVFLVMHIVRRRTDVMSTVRDTDGASHETPATTPASEAPTFAPLPPMALVAREDDVDQALRRFARNVKRRAA